MIAMGFQLILNILATGFDKFVDLLPGNPFDLSVITSLAGDSIVSQALHWIYWIVPVQACLGILAAWAAAVSVYIVSTYLLAAFRASR